MQSYDVIAWLRGNPSFFETHADELAEIYVPHLHRGQAISLTERQLLILREKNLGLEARLSELLKFGKENDSISEKLHRLTIDLMRAVDFVDVITTLETHLRAHFNLSKIAIRLWLNTPHNIAIRFQDTWASAPTSSGVSIPTGNNSANIYIGKQRSQADYAVQNRALKEDGYKLLEFSPVGESVLRLAQNLISPHCSNHIADEVLSWFGEESSSLKSFAQLALREDGTPFGLLALASTDPERFDSHMGTLYLQRLAELVATSLLRVLVSATPVEKSAAASQ